MEYNYQTLLDGVKKIHFIGIGGSGMCPLAEILYNEGYEITGSDINESDTLERIRGYNIKVTMGHYPENVNGADMVVYTAAVKLDNPELVSARAQGIPAVERCIMLGAVCAKYERSVAVSGTHGKTTTTSMLTQILTMCGLDPTAIIGGKLPFLGGNSRIGGSDIIVCEACEYVDTFLHLYPAVSIILNVDADHLDYFGTLDRVKESFTRFAMQTSRFLIVNGDDENTMAAVRNINKPLVTFGFNAANDYYAVVVGENKMFDTFEIHHGEQTLMTVSLAVPGRHNVLNALAAATAALIFGAEPKDVAEALESFAGAHRRFENLGMFGGVTVIDDFAHHPTELRATLEAAMGMGFNEVWAVFQPHTYSRTAMLLDDFAEVLSIPDHAILSEILAVREKNTYHIYARDLAGKIDGCVWFETFEEIADYAVARAKPGDLIITIGGGNVYMCANQIVDKLKYKYDA